MRSRCPGSARRFPARRVLDPRRSAGANSCRRSRVVGDGHAVLRFWSRAKRARRQGFSNGRWPRAVAGEWAPSRRRRPTPTLRLWPRNRQVGLTSPGWTRNRARREPPRGSNLPGLPALCRALAQASHDPGRLGGVPAGGGLVRYRVARARFHDGALPTRQGRPNPQGPRSHRAGGGP